jgi:ABC-type multidrug transport system permease subunit
MSRVRRWLRATWAIARKDVSVWARQPSAMAATVLPAFAFMLVIFVSAPAVGRNPVALVVLDDGPQAQRLAAILDSSDAFAATHATPDQARRLLDGLTVAAVVTIPRDFDRSLAAHQPDPVTIEIDNLNLDFTNDLRRSLPMAIAQFYGDQPGGPLRVTVRETDLRAEDVSPVQFSMVPTLAMLLTVAGVVNCGLATAREFEDLTVKELLLAPVGSGALVAGKLLAGWLTALLVAGVVLAAGAVTGLLRPAGWYWLSALGVIALFGLGAAGIGAALGSRLRRFQSVVPTGVTLAIILFFLSGGISVAAFLPEWVQAVARFTPTFYAVHALQMAIFYQSTEDLGRDVAVMVATVGLGLGAGVLSMRRSLVA